MPPSPALDLDFVRSQFPGLGEWAFFENAGGTLVPATVIDRVSAYMRECQVQPGASFDASALAAERIAESQRRIAAMINAARTLCDAYPGRFVLGIGVSHAPSVAQRGGTYGRPVETMTAYLDAMEAADYVGPALAEPPPVVLAALGPRMLELAAERADGAHPYFVPVEHTSMARDRMGPEPVLAVEMAAVIDTDAQRARTVARAFGSRYLGLENYANNLRRLGWGDDDLAGGGSNRLLDAVVPQGDAAAIAARVREHLDAGADHVCVQLRATDPKNLCLEAYAALRDELGGVIGTSG